MTRAERIIEARRMIDASEFDRLVTVHEPHSLYWDRLTLECGHGLIWLPGVQGKPPERRSCTDCATAWIDAGEAPTDTKSDGRQTNA